MSLNEIKHNNDKKEAEFKLPASLFLCMLYATIAVNTTLRMNTAMPNSQDHLAGK